MNEKGIGYIVFAFAALFIGTFIATYLGYKGSPIISVVIATLTGSLFVGNLHYYKREQEHIKKMEIIEEMERGRDGEV